MILYDLLNGKDKLKILGMWLLTVVCGCIVAWKKTLSPDLLVTVCFSMLFFAAFLLMVTNDYVLEEKEKHVHQMLQRVFLCYCGCVLLCTVGSVLTVPLRFVLAAAVILGSFVSVRYGTFLTLLISIVISLSSYHELVCSILLCIIGGMFSGILSRKKNRLQASVMLLAMYISVYFIGSYLSSGELSYLSFVKGCLEGSLNVLLILLFMTFSEQKQWKKDAEEYGFALEKEFPLMTFVKSLPEERYKHCRVAAKCCFLCAREAGLDEDLCCVAGFYYSLCDNDEQNPIEYAVRLAKQNGLPIPAVRILSQYHGVENRISTKEAALVDLVEEALGKLNSLSEKERTDPIMREMLVMKDFNDLSLTGRYDDSGLSMNSFLKIRDCLLYEVKINDSEYFQ